MQKKTGWKRLTALWPLWALYFSCVLIRCFFALITSNFPTVCIDEFLYYSMGRSIATEGRLLYLGQPALYNYLVYPLFLSPVYLLFPAGVNYYRVIQVWNILIMSLSVFPLFALCREMLAERKKAFLVTAVCMLLPDFILGQFVLSEAVIYPLFYTLMYCAYKNLRSPRLRYAVWIGVLGGLLYCAKPGAVVPAALALLLTAGKAAVKRSGRAGLSALAGAAGLAAVFFVFKLLSENAFGYRGAFFSVYDTQLNKYNGVNFDIFWQTAALYPYYFLLSCGVLPLIVALRRMPLFEKSNRRFLLLVLVSVLFLLIGTAWTVNRPERSTTLFLRYVDMYLPLVFILCLLPRQEEPAAIRPMSRRIPAAVCVLLTAYAAVCVFAAGSTAGIGGPYDDHFLFSLAVLFTRNVKGIANIAALLLCGSALYLAFRSPFGRVGNRLCCAAFAGVMLLSNVQGYRITAENTSRKLAQETAGIQRELGDEEYLFVRSMIDCDYGMDISSRKNIDHVEQYELYNHLLDNGGVYVPFVPDSIRGMDAREKTADVTTLVLDRRCYPLFAFSSAAEAHLSSGQTFAIVRFEKGARIVDGMLGNIDEMTLKPGTARPGLMTILNRAWIGQPVRIRLDIDSPAAQELQFSGVSFSAVKQLNEGRAWYEIVVGQAETNYQFTVSSESVLLYGFEIIPLSSRAE